MINCLSSVKLLSAVHPKLLRERELAGVQALQDYFSFFFLNAISVIQVGLQFYARKFTFTQEHGRHDRRVNIVIS